jgi:hypothetical protein
MVPEGEGQEILSSSLGTSQATAKDPVLLFVARMTGLTNIIIFGKHLNPKRIG